MAGGVGIAGGAVGTTGDTFATTVTVSSSKLTGGALPRWQSADLQLRLAMA